MTPIWAPFGTAYTFRSPVIKANSANFAASSDWPVYTAGTVKVIKDGGAGSNITTAPTVISGEYVWSWSLSSAEMTALEVVVQVVDRTYLTDQLFRIITLPEGAVRSRLAQGGTVSTIQLDATASSSDGNYVGSVVSIIAGNGAGQSRIITAYAQSTKTCTVDTNWVVTPNSTSVYAIYSSTYAITQSQNQAAATAALTAFGTSTLTQAQAQAGAAAALTAFGASTLTQAQSQTAATSALTAFGASTLTQAQAQSATNSALVSYGASTLTSGQVTAAVPTAAQISTQVMDSENVETGLTFRQSLRLMASVLFGRRAGTNSGTETFNAAITNAKTRVTATIDGSGNRTAITTDAT